MARHFKLPGRANLTVHCGLPPLTDGEPVAEVVDAVPHDHHPGYVGYARLLQIRAGVAGAVRVVGVLVVPRVTVLPQHGLVLVVVVPGGRVDLVLVDGVQPITVRMGHDLLLLGTQVGFGRRLLLALDIRQFRLIESVFGDHGVVGPYGGRKDTLIEQMHSHVLI